MGNKSKKNTNKRLHFGVLMSTIDDSCQCVVWDGISEYAKENDIHLTAYIGSYQTTTDDYASHYMTCFEAIRNNQTLDGVILLSGFIAHNEGLEDYFSMCSEICNKIPVVSVSYNMPDIPSVLTDNLNGLYSAVEHLIKDHGKKN